MVRDLTYTFTPAPFDAGVTSAPKISEVHDNLAAEGSRHYDYDALGRLLRATSGAQQNWSFEYGYDLAGNRTSTTATGEFGPGAPTPPDGLTDLSYDKANHITSLGFAYDKAGNLVAARVNAKDVEIQVRRRRAARFRYQPRDRTVPCLYLRSLRTSPRQPRLEGKHDPRRWPRSSAGSPGPGRLRVLRRMAREHGHRHVPRQRRQR